MNYVDPSCFYNIMKTLLPLNLKRLFKNGYFILNNIHLGPIAAFHGVTLVLLQSSVFYFNLLPLFCSALSFSQSWKKLLKEVYSSFKEVITLFLLGNVPLTCLFQILVFENK